MSVLDDLYIKNLTAIRREESYIAIWQEKIQLRWVGARIDLPAGLHASDIEWLEQMLRALDVPARPPRNPARRSRR